MKVRHLVLALPVLLVASYAASAPSQARTRATPALSVESPVLLADDEPIQQPKQDALLAQQALLRSRRQAAPVSSSLVRAQVRQQPRSTLSTVGACSDANWRSTLSPVETFIIKHESDFDPLSRNPSGAFGLGQLKPFSQIASYGIDNPSPCVQLVEMRSYISKRYGNESAAYAFWLSHHWY